ncbi:MAG: hypothetical protein Q9177_001522 [Variospora cf. flavescens]
MPEILSHEKRLKVVRLFLDKWQAKDIARDIGCSTSTIYHIKENLLNYGTIYKPQLKAAGRPTKVADSAKEAIQAFLQEHPEAQQKDVRLFLAKECHVEVHQATISRVVKELKTGEKYRDPKYTPKRDRIQPGHAGQSPGGPPTPQQVQQPPSFQLPTDRPLCGRPDCSRFNPPPGQVPSGQSPPSQSATDQVSSHQHPAGEAPTGQLSFPQHPAPLPQAGQASPAQLSLEQHPSPQSPPSPQPPYYARSGPHPADAVQQQPEHTLRALAEATEHHSETAPIAP